MEKEKQKLNSSSGGRSWLSGSIWYKAGLGLIGLACLAGAGLVIAGSVFLNKSYPNTTVAGVGIGGKNESQIRSSLRQVFSDAQKKGLTFNYKTKKWVIPAADLELSYNVDKTVNEVMAYSRVNSYPRRLWRLIKAVFVSRDVTPSFTYDKKVFDAKLNQIGETVSESEVDATAVVKNGKVNVVNEKYGTAVDMHNIGRMTSKALANFNKHILNVPVVQVKPKVTRTDTAEGIEEAQRMLDSRVKLVYKNNDWTITPKRVGGWINFDTVGVTSSGDVTAYEENAQVKSYRMKASLNQKEVQEHLDRIAKGIDKPAKNAKVEIVNNKPKLIGTGIDGFGINKEKAIADIIPMIEGGEKGTITMASSVIKPEVSAENIDEIGIKEMLGQARTLFYGSSLARVQNIGNGARLINGTLIKPGEEFSAGDTIGEIDGKNGFVEGLVIKDNKTVPEYGGGLCQVATTLFRAALRSGLKISERQNHSYRVSYYEKDDDGNNIGPGLDSTVYFPHPDLKFINDTGHYILITAEQIGYRVTFKLWGTKDGRSATIDGPHLLKTTPAPPTKYINTSTMYVGQTKMMESSHPGGTAVAYYTVTRGGKTLFKQTFRSWYKPWAGVYLVGTKKR